MRRYIETFILFVVGLGPTLIALLLMQQYGAIGVSCAIVLSALYLLCIIIALCCRICLPPSEADADDEELQGDAPDDLPPSYEIVTSKPPPYYVLFASAPSVGEITRSGLVTSNGGRRTALIPACDAPVHSFGRRGSSHGIQCYAWLEPCEDKDLPSYEDALALQLSSSNNQTKEGALAADSEAAAMLHSPNRVLIVALPEVNGSNS